MLAKIQPVPAAFFFPSLYTASVGNCLMKFQHLTGSSETETNESTVNALPVLTNTPY
jgi:hypothetical protein